MITGGLVNVVPLKRRNQFTKWRREAVTTPHGLVAYEVVHQVPHEDLWLYVIHGRKEYIGCFFAEHFSREQIAQTAADFACSTILH